MKVTVVKLDAGQVKGVLFRAELENGEQAKLPELPSVSLSRIKGKCFFRLDQMQMHDEHAPSWKDGPEMEAYIQRVTGDIVETVKALGFNVKVETQEKGLLPPGIQN